MDHPLAIQVGPLAAIWAVEGALLLGILTVVAFAFRPVQQEVRRRSPQQGVNGAATMKQHNKTKAIAYLRISSAANVGADKDSEKRQRLAISRFAAAAGF